MRIGFCIYGSLDLVSGGFIYDRHLVRSLRARGHEVAVLALPWRGFAAALGGNLAPWPPLPFDVVVQDSLVHPAVFARNRRAGVPVVALVHNLAHRPERRWSLPAAVERRYLCGVDGIIAVCATSLADARRAGAVAPGVVARTGRDHLAPAMDDTAVDARSAEPGALRLLHVGTVMPHKGLRRLVEALPEGVTLDVAGSLTAAPGYVSGVRRAVARRGLVDRVRLHGQIDGQALWALYRRSHAFALPSDSEAYSLACLEALGYGLPVMVTARGGMGEMITGGDEGWLLDPDDIPAWAGAIRRLAAARAVLAAMGRRALARFARHGSWSDTAATVETFLDGLAAGDRTGTPAHRGR